LRTRRRKRCSTASHFAPAHRRISSRGIGPGMIFEVKEPATSRPPLSLQSTVQSPTCRGRDTGRPVPPSQIPACSFPAPGSSRWHVVFAHRKVCPLGPSFLRHGLPVCASPTRRPLLQRRGLRLAAGYYEPIRLPECQTALLVVAPPFLLSPRS